MFPITRTLALGLLGLLFCGGSAWSQPAALDRAHRTSGLFEIDHPFLSDIDPAWSTIAVTLAARHRVTRNAAVVVEAPFSRFEWTETVPVGLVVQDSVSYSYGTTYVPARKSGNASGNVYLGVEFLDEDAPQVIEVGVRAPLVYDHQSRQAVVGFLSDLSRWEAYFRESASVRAGFRVHTVEARRWVGRGQMALTFTRPGQDAQIHFSGVATLERRLGAWMASSSLAGRVIATEYPPLGDRVVGQVELAAARNRPRGGPGLFARVYLNRVWRELSRWNLGLRYGRF